MQQLLQAGGELIEEGTDRLDEPLPVIGDAMEVQDLLVELAPELVNGVEPIGRDG